MTIFVYSHLIQYGPLQKIATEYRTTYAIFIKRHSSRYCSQKSNSNAGLYLVEEAR